MIEVRPTTLLRYHAHTRFDLDFQSQASYGHDQHIQTHFKGQSVQQIEWKQTDGQADGQTDSTDCFSFPANAVGRY